MGYRNAILISFGVVGTIYVIRQILLPKLSNIFIKAKHSKKIQEIMLKEGVGFDSAKERLIDQSLAKHFEIEKTEYEINGKKIKLGQRTSFQTEEYGFISGKFLGVRSSKAEGYTYNLFIYKNDEKNVISVPVEAIHIDTIMVYGG